MLQRNRFRLARERPPPARQVVDILKFNAHIEQRPIHITEGRETAQVLHPPFNASCCLQLRACSHQSLNYSVGFVQLVSSRKCQLDYDIGRGFWEFGGLGNGEMIVDSDGRQMPFYGATKEVVNVRGRVDSDQQICIRMVDQPSIKFSWSLDLWACSTSDNAQVEKIKPVLEGITRHQTFLTCVLLLDHNTNEMHILKAVEWKLNFSAVVDLQQAVGRRLTVFGRTDMLCMQPKMIRSADRKKQMIRTLGEDKCATMTANDSDTLVWKHEMCINAVTIVKSRVSYDDLKSNNNKSYTRAANDAKQQMHLKLLKKFINNQTQSKL
ncbi:protein FAM78B-like [Corticium candelabrum]|uniref:protein FAM78B-like n=1 Tax=Corticium candelabrum TaxID=121492 RepID=UPI002E252ACB|nr:protein FAM78B-like [Corticium candelabrum]